MPTEKIGETVDDLTTEGRYVQVTWRRDENEPGYAQVSTHGPDDAGGEFVHLDAAGLDRLIKTLHRAKRQAFGETESARLDRIARTYDADVNQRGVDPVEARHAAWSAMGHSDEDIAEFEKALGGGVLPPGTRWLAGQS